jgi:hypothetical protein
VQKNGTAITIFIYKLQKAERKMRMAIVLLLLITVVRIIPAKALSDNSYFEDDDDDDDDDEGPDITQEEEGVDETEENPPVETESTPVDDDMNKMLDEEWLKTAVQDIAYYLRAHKFNDFDRRNHLNEDTAPRVSNLNISETKRCYAACTIIAFLVSSEVQVF